MRKSILTVAVVLALASVTELAQAESKARYVGGGRYQCHDRSAECAMVKQNNRRITQDEIDARERKPYRNPDPSFGSHERQWSPPATRSNDRPYNSNREQRR
jgi:hypothetical protein